jgi:hypothetical protein
MPTDEEAETVALESSVAIAGPDPVKTPGPGPLPTTVATVGVELL